MSMTEHIDYEKETARLEETISYIVRIISLVVDKRLKYRQDMREAFTELDDMDSSLSYANILLNTKLLDSLEQNFSLLKRSKDHPYFARMDIRQSDKDKLEEIYIGKISLFDESMDTPLVVDWRAPISSVYYDGRLGRTRYSAYGDEFEIDLHLKRQYTIENGELKHYVDVDISMSDTFLQATLENHASDKLKDIVSTIQAEQNDIIRADIHKPLIVQGVAGSGKTTIALHRIAYLIYTYSDSFSPEDFIIIAPNNLFLDYISGVLPELGAEKVRQTTFIDLMMEILGQRFKLTDQNEKLSMLLPSDSQKETDIRIRASAFKNSMVMRDILEEHLKNLGEHFLPEEDFIFDGDVLYTRKYLDDMFHNSYTYLPYFKRIDQIRQYLESKVKEAVSSRISKVENIYENRMNRVRLKEAPSEERRGKLKELMKMRDERIGELKKSRKNLIRDYFKKMDYEDTLTYYLQLMTDENFISGFVEEKDFEVVQYVVEDTLRRARTKELEIEDLAPLAYMHSRLYGVESSVRVKYVVIDEAQDFSDFQFYALRNILNTDRFTILGDLSQGIHMYRSISDWTYLKNHIFKEETNYLTLLQSYRTTIEIMESANEVLTRSPIRDLTLAKPVVRHGKKPAVKAYMSERNLIRGILNTMNAWTEEGYTTIAVITKTAADAAHLHKALKQSKDLDISLIGEKAVHFTERYVVLPAHLAKGLEFDGVIVTNLNDAYKITELDAKLLYVAMTRAMHRLSVLFLEGTNPYFSQD